MPLVVMMVNTTSSLWRLTTPYRTSGVKCRVCARGEREPASSAFRPTLCSLPPPIPSNPSVKVLRRRQRPRQTLDTAPALFHRPVLSSSVKTNNNNNNFPLPVCNCVHLLLVAIAIRIFDDGCFGSSFYISHYRSMLRRLRRVLVPNVF